MKKLETMHQKWSMKLHDKLENDWIKINQNIGQNGRKADGNEPKFEWNWLKWKNDQKFETNGDVSTVSWNIDQNWNWKLEQTDQKSAWKSITGLTPKIGLKRLK